MTSTDKSGVYVLSDTLREQTNKHFSGDWELVHFYNQQLSTIQDLRNCHNIRLVRDTK